MTIGLMSTPFTTRTISGAIGSILGSGDRNLTVGSKTDQPISTTITSRRAYPRTTGDVTIVSGIGTVSLNGSGIWLSAITLTSITDYFQARVTSSGSYETAIELVLDVDGNSDTFSVTTESDVAYALDPDGNIMLDPDGNPIEEF